MLNLALVLALLAPQEPGVLEETPVLVAPRGAIQAPTLIVHAADDTLQTWQNAAFAAATIPAARLMRFERGGHLLMAIEQATIGAAIQKHIRDHAS